MLRINHDFRGHLWCGIGSLAAALDIPTSKAKAIVKSTALRKYIKAISYEEMAHALVAEGKKIERQFFPRNWRECFTLDKWYEQESLGRYLPSHRVFVICITNHWIVVRGDQWVCSMNQKPRNIKDCPYLRSRVRHIIYFDDMPNPDYH